MREKSGIHLDSIVAPAPLSSKDIDRARAVVATHSVGVEDCRELLDMLGLNFVVDDVEST